MNLTKKQSEEFEGRLLLQFFRDEQAKFNNYSGCKCNECETAMINAWKRFKATIFEKVSK